MNKVIAVLGTVAAIRMHFCSIRGYKPYETK